MAKKRDDIVIGFGGDDSRFQKVARRVSATGERIKGAFGGIGSFLSGLGRGGLISVITAVGTAFAAMAKGAVRSADALEKTADKVGVSIENLQRLRYAASTTGVEQRTLDMAMQRFSRRLAEAANGTGVLYKELIALGIEVRDSNGNMRSSVDLLAEYSDAVSEAESSQEQLRLSFVAFDSEGAKMVNLMRQGSDGMASLMQRADELGVVLGEHVVRESAALNQTWDEFALRWETTWKGAILGMATYMDKAAGNLRTVNVIQEKINENVIEAAKTQERLNKAHALGKPALERYIKKLQDENAELVKKRDLLEDVDRAQKKTAGETLDEAGAAPAGKKLAKGPKPTDPTEDYLAYKAGEITREEWLDRTSTSNPYRHGPGQEVAQPLPSYNQIMPEEVAHAIAKATESAVASAMGARIYTIQLKPEIVGLEGLDLVFEDAVDKEGGTGGGF